MCLLSHPLQPCSWPLEPLRAPNSCPCWLEWGTCPASRGCVLCALGGSQISRGLSVALAPLGYGEPLAHRDERACHLSLRSSPLAEKHDFSHLETQTPRATSPGAQFFSSVLTHVLILSGLCGPDAHMYPSRLQTLLSNSAPACLTSRYPRLTLYTKVLIFRPKRPPPAAFPG